MRLQEISVGPSLPSYFLMSKIRRRVFFYKSVTAQFRQLLNFSQVRSPALLPGPGSCRAHFRLVFTLQIFSGIFLLTGSLLALGQSCYSQPDTFSMPGHFYLISRGPVAFRRRYREEPRPNLLEITPSTVSALK